MGYHFLFQGILSTEGLKLCLLNLLHWQADSLPVSRRESTARPPVWLAPGGAVCNTGPVIDFWNRSS